MWEQQGSARRTSCWPAEFRHQDQSGLTAPHVGFKCPGIKTLLWSIRFYFHKELPSAFQDKTSRSESLRRLLVPLTLKPPPRLRLNGLRGGVLTCSGPRLSGSIRVMIGPLLTGSRPSLLPPCTSSVLPRITHLLNEFPAAAVWHVGTPPFNWPAHQPGRAVKWSGPRVQVKRASECLGARFGISVPVSAQPEKRRRN